MRNSIPVRQGWRRPNRTSCVDRSSSSPPSISVAEVINVLDGPLSILPCSNGRGNTCKQFSHCTIRDPLAEIELRVKGLLEEITLEDVSGSGAASAPDWPPFQDFSRRQFAAGLPVG